MKFVIELLSVMAALLCTTGCEEVVVYATEGTTVTLSTEGLQVNTGYWYWSRIGSQQDRLAWHNRFSGWLFTKDARWTGRLSISKHALSITSVQQQDFGTFVLSKLVTIGDVRPVKTFRLFKITASADPASSPVLPGEFVTLSCHVDSPDSDNMADIYWLSPAGSKIRQREGKVQVDVTGRDHGIWSCIVMREQKEARATVSITVLDLLPAPLHPQYVPEQSSLSIPCSFPSHLSWKLFKARGLQEVHWCFIPKPPLRLVTQGPQKLFSLSLMDETVAWTFVQSRGFRPVPGLQTGNLFLNRKGVTAEDRGDYVCTFNFSSELILKRTVSVEVLQIVSSTGPDLISGQPLNLTCGLGHELPSDLSVKWIPPEWPSVRSQLSAGHHPAQIVIPEVSQGDGGRWRCDLWRGAELLTSAEMTLAIATKWSVWMLVTVCGAAVIIFVLLLLICITWRHRQRNMRRLKHGFCRCKNPKPKGYNRR
ncbi:CD4-1 molecule [Dunckerocampus dactyliophorus]|uniref:CD4-1 molecule n=1 Tax=Dunckerocampus dactyliophorus TaxID=161453 RepID=UPI0024075974|nr:CD4-1 molecule [Dunckerocampus dactyliophorus]XP_054637960.1 CD4-1 molecule [Dunckerocampus dactyliophorus]